ncbi:MAG: YihY/virulence factor BrkB family protein, partial [Muribaculaceae bacterium]|nr:YihY/virulence factor BrkB family protein [Muribaculaceae bacterium]
MSPTDSKKQSKTALLAEKWRARVTGWIQYVSVGVWEQPDTRWYIRFLKVVNLSVRSFTDRDLQSQASSLTYSTLLATVPVLAMLFAIARGFGFQNILKSQLFTYFPAQREVLDKAFTFVDSYLNQASEGLFVGVGLIVMLWTLISLISNVESTFNLVWGVKHGRSLWRRITDYTAIFLVLPILMICASGINVFMSSTLQEAIPFRFLTPMVSGLLDLTSLMLTWFFFVGAYLLIPNTRVPFKNAFLAGILTGIGFTVLQWLFVSGAVYVRCELYKSPSQRHAHD